jgi:hypothetical protein
MRLRLSKRWRRRLSVLLISSAGMLPARSSPTVERLQRIAAERVKRAKDVVASVESSSYSLKYCGFSIVELFPIELLPKVIDAATDLFPSLEARDTLDVYRLGYVPLGIVYRTKPLHLIMALNRYRLLLTLPAWVERVDLSLSRQYDSTFIVTADVITTSIVDDLLANHLAKASPAGIELNRLSHISNLGYARTEYSEFEAYSTSFQDFLVSLRSSIQRALFLRFFPFGYFLSHGRNLPAIDLMEVVGGDAANSDDWVNETQAWRDKLGINFERDYYSGEGIAVGISRDLPVTSAPLWRIVLRSAYQPPRNISREPISGRESAVAIQSHLAKTLHALAATAHQGVVASLLSEFRRKVFLSGARHLMILQQTSLYERLCSEWLLFERSKRDLQDGAAMAKDDVFLKALRYRTAFMPALVSDKPADVDLHESGTWGYEQLTTGLEEIRTHFSDVLAARNYGATFLLTLIAIFVAILSFVVSVAALRVTQDATPPRLLKLNDTVLKLFDRCSTSKARAYYR